MRVFALCIVAGIVCVGLASAADNPVGPHYNVQVRQGSDGAWQDHGQWVLGGRADERPIEIRIASGNKGKDVVGQVKYRQKEGMLGVNLRKREDRQYASETWKGDNRKMPEARWVIGHGEQTVKRLEAKSTDAGETLTGTITYEGQEPMEFKATRVGGKELPASAPAPAPAKSSFDGAYGDGKIRLVIHENGSNVVIFGEESQALLGKLTSTSAEGFEGVIEHEGKQHKLKGQRIAGGKLRVSDGDDTFELAPDIDGTYANQTVQFIVSLDGKHFTLKEGDTTLYGSLKPVANNAFSGSFDADQKPLTGQRSDEGVSITYGGRTEQLKPVPHAGQ